jgi:hypothetical protein
MQTVAIRLNIPQIIEVDGVTHKCKIACNIDPLRGLFASNSDPL